MKRQTITALAMVIALSAEAQLRYGLRLGGSGECPHLSGAPGWKASGVNGFSGGADSGISDA